MRQRVAEIDLAAVEMDSGDESVFVPANIEHDKLADFVRRWEGGPHGLKTRKVVPLPDFEPSSKGTFTIGVPFPKLA